jgi:DNA-directed RNA polymerase specialized sigma24 family protein
MKKYVDKKRVKELAQEFGRSEKAIESELFRARKEFRLLWANLEK